MNHPRTDGKPGETWRVSDGKRWARWQILDGNLLKVARDLGYEGTCVICLAIGYHDHEKYGSPPSGWPMQAEELYALGSLDESFFDPDDDAVWVLEEPLFPNPC